MSMRGVMPEWEARLRSVAQSAAANSPRHLFQELNPELEVSPIFTSPPKVLRPASVLIPVVHRPNGPNVLFMVRAATMPSHAGEIGFPGGGPKETDGDDPVATALREAHEEVGIPPDRVDVLARFAPHIGGLGYAVTPVVGLVESSVEICPCEREVCEAFEVPLAHLTDLSNHRVEDRILRGKSYRMFAVPSHDEAGRSRHIWGLTAGIVHSFARAYSDVSVAA